MQIANSNEMLVKTYCAAVNGLDVNTVTCEVSMSRGVQFHLTGLADTAVKESYDRIKAALVNNGFKMPSMDITVNLSPADIKKEGSGYDLPLPARQGFGPPTSAHLAARPRHRAPGTAGACQTIKLSA